MSDTLPLTSTPINGKRKERSVDLEISDPDVAGPPLKRLRIYSPEKKAPNTENEVPQFTEGNELPFTRSKGKARAFV